MEMYSRDQVGKNLSDSFLIKNTLKQDDALSPLLFNFALVYAIRRVQVSQDGLKLNGTHQLVAYADDVNIFGGSVHAVKENIEASVAATKEIGLKVNADKTKYMVMSRERNVGRNHNIRIDNSSFETVEVFKYFGTTLTNQNSIQEGAKIIIEVKECLLLLGAKSFVFQVAIQQNYNFTRHSVWG
jgi:uncharacterized protein (UPF0179 family)